MNRNSRVWHNVATFVALTAVISGAFGALIVHSGHMSTGGWVYVRGAMWAPGLSALVLHLMGRWNIASAGWRWDVSAQLRCYLLPIAAATAVYSLAWTTGVAGFPNPRTVSTIASELGWVGVPTPLVVSGYALLTLTLGMLPAVASVLGEELGWRGYLVPELAKVYGFRVSALVSAGIWAVWHYPVILAADYNRGAPLWFTLFAFTLLVVSGAVICAWLRLNTHSIWPSVVLHAATNLVVQDVLTPLTVERPMTPYVTDEFGLGLPLVACSIAVVCWRRSGVEHAPRERIARRITQRIPARAMRVVTGS